MKVEKGFQAIDTPQGIVHHADVTLPHADPGHGLFAGSYMVRKRKSMGQHGLGNLLNPVGVPLDKEGVQVSAHDP
jgi:hypothetical protein